MIATAVDWQGTARTPGALAAAGFEPYLLAPESTYARLSVHTRAHYQLKSEAPLPMQAITVATVVDRLAPDILMPCDDQSLALLGAIAHAPVGGVPSDVYARLRALIALSIGDPASLAPSIDKLQFAAIAKDTGVRVPTSIVATDVREAQAFGTTQGFPVVLKRSQSSGGKGVTVSDDARELAADFRTLQGGDDNPLLVQAFVHGATWYANVAAWQGEVLCAYGVQKVEGYLRGPATVVRYFHHGPMLEAAAALARRFKASGLFGAEFVAEKDTQLPWVIELNRRPSPGTHRGRAMDVDMYAALRNALTGTPLATRARLDDDEVHQFVHLPLEWMRDPDSLYLIYQRSDAPIDDPRLFAALFDLGWKVNRLREQT